jgi:hypothetical protein
LVQGVYEVTAYEARTRRVLRVRALRGENSECPRQVRSDVSTVYTAIAMHQFQQAMGDIVGS